jgi:4-diphosphocytidyl-2-C-methyl-D-erythritol kinase
LVVRALELLRERTRCELGARVRLVKRIPTEAGMGGGSSDAAAALRLGSQAWQLDLPPAELSRLAAELGSDVPFFLAPSPAVCRGRGEQVQRLPYIPPLNVVIVKPPQGLTTADVYQAWDTRNEASQNAASAKRDPHRLEALIAALCRGDLHTLGRAMTNRLQAAASTLSPWIDRLQAAFSRLDFVGHQLTGSGTAYFGIARHAQHARRLATILRTRQLGLVCTARTCR